MSKNGDFIMLGLLRCCALVCISAASISHAADIVRDVKVGREPMVQRGGYLELGGGLSYQQVARDILENSDFVEDGFGLTVAIGFAYNYNRLFVEASEGSFDGLNIGLNLHQSEHWSFDILAASLFGSLTNEYNQQETDVTQLSDAEKNDYLLQRDTLYSGTGLRATYYTNNYIAQFRVVKDIYDEAGVTSTLRIGRSWLYKNWNIHAIASAEYSSATTNNYLFGVSADEATSLYSLYEAGDALSFSGELGLTYPVSKNWVYRSFVRYRALPDAITDSPLVSTNHEALVFCALLYVF